MDLIRTFLIAILAILSFQLWIAWEEDYGKSPTQIAETSATPQVSSQVNSTPPQVSDDIPRVRKPSEQATTSAPTPITTSTATSQNIVVTTDVLKVVIDSRGGDIVYAELLDFPESLGSKNNVVLMMKGDGRTYVAQSGFVGSEQSPDSLEQRVIYQSTQPSYQLQQGKDFVDAVFGWSSPEGVHYQKVFRFYRGKYSVDIQHVIQNDSPQPVEEQIFAQIKRDQFSESSSGFAMATYTGGAYGSSEVRYEKVDFDDINEKNMEIKTQGGWVGMLQHYFVTAFIPNKEKYNDLYTQKGGSGLAIIGYRSDSVAIQAGQSHQFTSVFYVGPKVQDELEKLHEDLDLVVDYGFLWWIAQPLFMLLQFYHSIVGNWGVAIILVTVTVKGLFYRLSAAQYRSMAKMRQVQPKLMKIRERYANDRQKLSQEMMNLYKKEKVNPLGGCLPLLIQMPVFIALYWCLMESVELRQAPFALWIQDLSIQDPYYILPVLMGLSMFFMQKLSPQAFTDPMQQRVMQIMPILMTGFFLFFPAGLVLYWVVNNCLSMLQQWYITRTVENEASQKKSG